ncbi:MAG: GNAT family N-acetyltransferase [Chloroflexia bacterium]|nr:GNAT family N-acetyltransferase [Chloroflexia bacterium]
MIIRTPTQSDPAQANNLAAGIDGCFMDASVPDRNEPGRFRRTFVAALHDQVVGIGVIFRNWLHPLRLTVDVVVAPDHRRTGIGTALLDRLVAAIPTGDARSLKAACWNDDEASEAFWRSHRFAPIMRTDIGTIDVTQACTVASAEIPADGITIVSGDQISQKDSLWDEIAQLHDRVYRANHEWSPPTPIDLPLARQVFLDPDDLIPEALVVALRDDRPFAMASLRALTSEGTCELGWAGGDPTSGQEGFRVARILVAHCLALARERGWAVGVEADQADPILQDVVKQWPLRDHRIWVNYGRREQEDLLSV